tara:strand:+ start:184 stop:441 length:258 start_codon:yes stop_codon:yes gene_type:complete
VTDNPFIKYLNITGQVGTDKPNYTNIKVGTDKNYIKYDTNKKVKAEFNKNNLGVEAFYDDNTKDKGIKFKFRFNKGGLASKKGFI